MLRKQSQKKLRKENWKSIYRIRIEKQLSTYEGSEGEIVILEEKRQIHLYISSRSQQSS